MKLMKFLGFMIAAIVLAKIFVFPDYRHRFRLTIAFDTPDGVKSASGVHEVVRKDMGWTLIALGKGQYVYRFHGEAIFLDLGRGKHVIALLALGPTAELRIGSIGMKTYFPERSSIDEAVWSARYPDSGPLQLPEHLLPTLVTFTDLTDPKSAHVVMATGPGGGRFPSRNSGITVSRTAELLGPGYAFRSASIERVAAGIWPLDTLGLYGEPITEGIEKKLPAILATLRAPARERPFRHPYDSLKIGPGHLIIP